MSTWRVCIVVAVAAFVDVLQTAVARLGSQKAAIAAAGVSRQRFADALRGGRPFRPEKCLRLAIRSKQDPGEVLRAAGLRELAELIEQIYERPDRNKPTAAQRAVLNALDALDEATREHLTAVLFHLAGHGPKGTRRRA